METERLTLKLFAVQPCEVTAEEYTLFFHRVIQEGALAETFVDVTDYSHVPGGPGVMLICHEAHYSTDRAGGRPGLRCATKRGGAGDLAARIRRLMNKTLTACAVMERSEIFGKRLRFSTGSALFSIEDRLLAPPTDETFAAVAPVLTDVAARVWGAPPTLARTGTPKECFRVAMTFASAPPLQDLSGRA